MKTLPTQAKRVLIYRLGSLGDTVVALPAYHLIARCFPHADRRLLTNIPVAAKAPAAAAVLGESGLVHGYFRYRVGERGLKPLLDLRRELRQWRPDVLVTLTERRSLPAILRDYLFFRACGIPHLYGFAFDKGLRQPRREPTGLLEHMSEFIARRLKPELGDAHVESPASWDLGLTATEIARADQALAPAGQHPILAVGVGTKVQSKDWGTQNWANLLGRLALEYPSHALVMIGAKEDAEVSAIASAAWHQQSPASPIIDLCGKLSPRESAAALGRARLFLGLDSGPMHLAATMGTRVVAIFAARNIPALWYPYGPNHRVLYHTVDCAGCGLETCIEQQKKCILSITVDEVLAAVKETMPA